ncbi:homoserine kinase [Ilumatobacter sp.]|uniref:homoserine kinase n=1 Tax=Ilumatobacter sp. TaxID=1967498 RepID=UPI003B523F32
MRGDPATSTVVRAPASSANLGAGFDVFGLALGLHADVGTGRAPDGARDLDAAHPARVAFERAGGSGPIWLRSPIPVARGLGFSGAVRVAAAGLGHVVAGGTIDRGAERILAVSSELEGHGDNAAASLHGGFTAYVAGRALRVPVGPVLASATVVAWIPDVTTSTDRSRRALTDTVERRSAVANVGRAVQMSLAFERDDPSLLDGATSDELHQSARMGAIPGAADAMAAGVAAGAWCGWLSGSGPTVALLAARELADEVTAALPRGGHVKVLDIDSAGAHVVGARPLRPAR